MNIQVQCCGIVLLLMLIYFSLRNKHVGLYTEYVFLRVVLITLGSVCMDVLSIIAIVNRDKIPEWLLESICKTYVSSLVWVGYLGLIYVLTDLFSEKIYRRTVRKYTILSIFSTILIFSLPIYYYCEGQVIYTYGLSILMTYLFAILFVFDTVIHIVKYRNKMNRKRRQAVIIWMAIWMTAAGIQFINNSLLLVGFACCLGMLVLFFMLENPEANIDRQIGCFNSSALVDFMKQEYARNNKYSIMLISYTNSHNKNIDDELIIDELRLMVDSLKHKKKLKIFKDVEEQLILIFDSEEELNITLEEIQYRLDMCKKRKDGAIQVQPSFLILYNSQLAKNEAELFQIFRYYLNQELVLPENNVFLLDEDKIDSIRYKESVYNLILDAIEKDQLEVFFQPIYSTQKGAFTSAEALVRIRNNEGCIIYPDTFISVAEEYGLIKEIGEIVFEKTCKFIRDKNVEQLGVSYIEINLSVVQCENVDLADRLINIMKKYDVNPSCINLEITETSSILIQKLMLENMRKLIEYGVSFSLDDFGNGHSNLNYITDMPFEIIKLDMDLIRKYFTIPKANLVVNAATNMVHEMGLSVVAEGVETKEQYEEMKRIGIDYIQGYYFSRPIPQTDYYKFLQKHNKEEKKE